MLNEIAKLGMRMRAERDWSRKQLSEVVSQKYRKTLSESTIKHIEGAKGNPTIGSVNLYFGALTDALINELDDCLFKALSQSADENRSVDENKGADDRAKKAQELR